MITPFSEILNDIPNPQLEDIMKEKDVRECEASSQARTGGEWFLKILQSMDVKYIFGTTGGGMPDIQDAMTAVKPPIWIQSLHEFPAISAAMGYALGTEGAAVCLIDRTVGTINAMGGFYAAYENFAPVVIFASRNLPAIASGYLADGRPRYAVHYHSWQAIFTEPWTKWRHELARLDTLPFDIQKAFLAAVSQPSGPTYMTLRQDLMAARVEAAPLPRGEVGTQMSRMAADIDSVKAAAELLVEAENPIIYATSMGRHASAIYCLVELAEAIGCGVLDGRAFLNFPMGHPLFQDFYSWRERDPLMEDADVVLSIENYYEPPFGPPEDSAVIDVRPDPLALQGGSGGDYGGGFYPAAQRLIGGSATILSQLSLAVNKLIDGDAMRRSTIDDRFESNRVRHEEKLATWAKEREGHLEDDPISPHKIAYELDRLWDDDTVWMNSTITMRKSLRQGIHINQPGTYFTNPSGHLGPIAGAAYGMALAKPDKKVVAMVGDGDFVMGNPPAVLWTCSHYRIPVLYIVFNNACWGIEWPFIVDTTLKLSATARNYECVDIDKPRLNFKKMAESTGVRAEVIEHPDEAREVLERGFKALLRGEPSLIEVRLPKYTEGESSYRYLFSREAVPVQIAPRAHAV